MACFRPIAAFERPGGRVQIGFDRGDGRPFRVPCGKCVGCLLERSRQWAVRCMHEASLYDENCFVTLTYDDEHLPAGGSLNPPDLQKFWKRLRQELVRERGVAKVRYFACGEYGTRYGRPHYHALVFGFDFADKQPLEERSRYRVWRSARLERLWPLGISQLGSVTYESAAYVARYCVGVDSRGVVGVDADGVASELEREFATMSRRPHGIGRGWFEKYGREVYPADGVVVEGKLRKPPRYYDVAVEAELPEVFEEVREKRRRARRTDLPAAEKCLEARLVLKRRELEE